MFAHMHTCHSAKSEVRGQLAGVVFFFFLTSTKWVLGMEPGRLGLFGDRHLYLMSYLSNTPPPLKLLNLNEEFSP